MSSATSPQHEPSQTAWHAVSPDRSLAELGSSSEGLTPPEAARRLGQYGPNELAAPDRVSPWATLLAQFKNVLIVLLLFASGISAMLGHGTETVAIAVIVLLAVLLGFVQEYRAERAIEALREMAAPSVRVLRGGNEVEVPARELVPGDVALFAAGDRVAADARLMEAFNLQVDEAPLTGESVPVDKSTEAIEDAATPVADRTNVVFGGTTVTAGRATGIVVATGSTTEFGQIARMLEDVEPSRTPLQQNLDRVGRALAQAALAIVVVIVVAGLLRGQPWVEMLVFGVALAVAAVPEALPAVVTISLAIGVQRMVARNALVRRLPAVETLGSTSCICSDKTGTLTRGEMTARKLFTHARTVSVSGSGYDPTGAFSADGRDVEPSDDEFELLRGAALASDAHVLTDDEHGGWLLQGDPTEGALVVAAAKAGLERTDLDQRFPRVSEVPFSAESKRMTTLHDGPDGRVAYAKGAPEAVLASCTRYLSGGEESPIGDADRDAVLAAVAAMADEALRVLGVARKEISGAEDVEHDMTFLGLVGMIDPPRAEAREAIARCHEAGIRVIMITGDHPATASAIARELGLGEGPTLTGVELDALSDDELEQRVDDTQLYSRVSPAHKLRVVRALQARGEITAMTGDGVNDAPALRQADIGVAMGITGTDVSKEASAITLTDDNFESIVAAVEEGRAIFGNIKKYLMYMLSSNIGEIGLMAGATAAGLPLPLTAVQLLYVNLATDGFPALALSVDPADRDVMRQPPRDPRSGVFTRPVVTLMAVGGLWSMVANLSLFTWALQSGRSVPEAMTMTFVSLVLIQFLKAYSFRSEHRSILRRPFENRWLNLAIVWELALLFLIVTLPVLHEPFGTYALPAVDWLITLVPALTIVPVLEAVKWLIARRGGPRAEVAAA